MNAKNRLKEAFNKFVMSFGFSNLHNISWPLLIEVEKRIEELPDVVPILNTKQEFVIMRKRDCNFLENSLGRERFTYSQVEFRGAKRFRTIDAAIEAMEKHCKEIGSYLVYGTDDYENNRGALAAMVITPVQTIHKYY